MIDLTGFRGVGPVSYDELDLPLQSLLKQMVDNATRLKSVICNSIYFSFVTSSRIVKFKVECEDFNPEFDFVDVFANGRYISKNTYQYNSTNREIELNGYIDSNVKVFYIIYKYQNHNIKLFKHYDVDYTLDGEDMPNMIKEIPIPYDPEILTTSTYFEVYRDGYLIDLTTYRIDYENKRIIMSDGRQIPKNTTLVFSFVASYSRCIEVRRSHVCIPTTTRGRFRTDLNETMFNNRRHVLRLFCNGAYVPDSDYVLNRNIVSITSAKNYLPEGSIKTAVFREYALALGYDKKSLQKTNTEEFYVTTQGSKKNPIPIHKFHEENTNFGLFKENGVFVNSAKYYIDEGDIKFYDHDKGLERGDKLNFNVIEREGSIREFSQFVELLESNQVRISIPLDNYQNRKVRFMLFRSEGVYISHNKYIIEGDEVVITHPMRFDPGDVLEFRFLEYIGDTRYIRKRATEKIKIDAQNELTIPWDDYNPNTDNIILLRSDGMYIGKNRYTINYDTRKITIHSGSILTTGKWVDFILNRTLPEPIPMQLAYDEGGVDYERK